MRLSRHAWWLYLALIAPVVVGYLAGPLHARARYTTRSASARVVAMVVGVRMHRPTARWAWYVLAVAQVLFVGGDVLAYNYTALFGVALPHGLDRGRLLPLVLPGHRRRAAAPDPAAATPGATGRA